jgi:uncharacterized damage-inducible protein DinB
LAVNRSEIDMVADWLGRVIVRDLDSVRIQLEAYEDEEDIWKLVPGLTNAPGTLALHLAGNLQHYIGACLGGSGYVRDREAEFSTRGLTRAELLQVIDEARIEVQEALEGISDRQLQMEFPDEVAGVKLPTGQFLIHLAVHLAYHLGQVDYHRRVVTRGGSLSQMQSIPALV